MVPNRPEYVHNEVYSVQAFSRDQQGYRPLTLARTVQQELARVGITNGIPRNVAQTQIESHLAILSEEVNQLVVDLNTKQVKLAQKKVEVGALKTEVYKKRIALAPLQKQRTEELQAARLRVLEQQQLLVEHQQVLVREQRTSGMSPDNSVQYARLGRAERNVRFLEQAALNSEKKLNQLTAVCRTKHNQEQIEAAEIELIHKRAVMASTKRELDVETQTLNVLKREYELQVSANRRLLLELEHNAADWTTAERIMQNQEQSYRTEITHQSTRVHRLGLVLYHKHSKLETREHKLRTLKQGCYSEASPSQQPEYHSIGFYNAQTPGYAATNITINNNEHLATASVFLTPTAAEALSAERNAALSALVVPTTANTSELSVAGGGFNTSSNYAADVTSTTAYGVVADDSIETNAGGYVPNIGEATMTPISDATTPHQTRHRQGASRCSNNAPPRKKPEVARKTTNNMQQYIKMRIKRRLFEKYGSSKLNYMRACTRHNVDATSSSEEDEEDENNEGDEIDDESEDHYSDDEADGNGSVTGEQQAVF